jgi:hypothetical protein
MVKKWLRLNFKPRNRHGFKISAAIDQAVEAGRFPAAPREIGELIIHITTRIDMLNRLYTRIDNEWKEFTGIVSKHGQEHVYTPEDEGYAFNIDEGLKNDLFIDIDSFLFECIACCDLVKELLGLACEHTGKQILKKDIGRTIGNILKEKGQDISWFGLLDKSRNTFAHNATPYASVDITEEENNIYDLLIMKRNIRNFENKEEFIRLSDFSTIYQGFQRSLPIIEAHIAKLYAL